MIDGTTFKHKVKEIISKKGDYLGESYEVYEIKICPSCNEIMFFKYFWHDYMEPEDVKIEILFPQNNNIPSGLPEKIYKAYEAALKVRNIDANAYGVLLRRVLEYVLLDRKAEGKTVYEQLKNLSDRGEIPEILVRLSHNLRQFGNIGAHAATGDLTEEDIPFLDSLCKAILEYVYTAPLLVKQAENKLDELKKRRNK